MGYIPYAYLLEAIFACDNRLHVIGDVARAMLLTHATIFLRLAHLGHVVKTCLLRCGKFIEVRIFEMNNTTSYLCNSLSEHTNTDYNLYNESLL